MSKLYRKYPIPSGLFIGELMKFSWDIERSNSITYVRLKKNGYEFEIPTDEIDMDDIVTALMRYAEHQAKPTPAAEVKEGE